MLIFGSEIVKKLDEEAIRSGISSSALMERAAYGIYGCAEKALGGVSGRKIAVFCGAGNNGGDGAAFSLIARKRGADVLCVLTGDPGKLTADTSAYLELYREEGGCPVMFDSADDDLAGFVLSADLIVDAIYGIGFHGSLTGKAKLAAELINNSKALVISADIPSGAEADSALISDNCVHADYTVAFTCLKPAHCVQPAKSFCGKTSVCGIGIPKELIDARSVESESWIHLIDSSFLDRLITKRKADTHKGCYGKVLVIGGCIGYTGAPFMAASAAFRTGSGLVYMAVPESIYQIEAAKCNEIICMPFGETEGKLSLRALDKLLPLADKCDSCVIGPGMGRSDESDRLVAELLGRIACPVVLDADGINAVSGNINVLIERSSHGMKTVLTPHDAEFARLGGNLSGGRLGGSLDFAALTGAAVVLKGNTTITASPDGTAYVNTSGNPGMAKGGSGDLLAGTIASLIGQGFDLCRASAAGVFIHGAAGDLAALSRGEYGMLPSDLLFEIPAVLKKYDSKEYGGGT